MARNAEGSYRETHAALAHATRSEILTYLRGKDYVRTGQITEDLLLGRYEEADGPSRLTTVTEALQRHSV